jgi:hypothetical protein
MESQFTLGHIKEGNYIRVRVAAPVTRDMAAVFAAQAEAECKRKGCPGYLVDARGFPNVETINDNYEYSAWDLKQVEDKTGMKHAILVDVDDDSHDLPILAMQEMGFNARKFTDEQEAVAWLTGSA